MRAPDAVNPFDLLGLTPSFEIDAAAIQTAYLAKAARLHPDLAVDNPEAQANAASASARLNDARNTLLDPEPRAEVLVALLSGEQDGEQGSEAGGKAPPSDPAFLMEMMELRERVEAELDDPSDTDARTRWEAWAAEQRDELLAGLGGLFSRAMSDEAGRAEVLGEIRQSLTRLRYIQRLIDQLDDKESSGPGMPGVRVQPGLGGESVRRG